MERGWRVAPYGELAAAWAGFDWETISVRLREQDPAALARWERAATDFPDSDRTTHSVRGFFGISSFGASVTRPPWKVR